MLFYERISTDKGADVSQDSSADMPSDAGRADGVDDDDAHKYKIDLSPDLAEVSLWFNTYVSDMFVCN